ncbi:MAG: acyl-CoA thioesterase, partial [Candidatus Hydrogenedentes bacterium]|nr:acyl-CoA thioesterase [Candidatus Hydrogenedentota bacterium]
TGAAAEIVTQDRFARHVGVELLDVAEGRATARMDVAPCHFNGIGMIHGSAIFTLADYAFAAAANAAGAPALSVNMSISFMKSSKGKTLFAEAQEVAKSRKVGHYRIMITDEDKNEIAIVQGIAYRK